MYYFDDFFHTIGIIFWVLVIVIAVVMFYISVKFIDVAVAKGYEHSLKWFWIVFFCGIFGAMYIIALPDRNREYHESVLRNVLKENGSIAAETRIYDKDELPDL